VALNKDVKVALLTFLSVILFIVAYLFMKGTLLQSGNPKYCAIFQNVDKVKKSDHVYLSGVVVGTVDKIEFTDLAHPKDVRVIFTADKELKIPKDSKIQITSTSIMGNMGLVLHLGNSNEVIREMETIMGLPENGILQSLSSEIGPLAKSSDSLLHNVNSLFDRGQKENVYITVDQMNATLATVNITLANMNRMIENNQKPIHQTMVNFERISTSLAKKQDDINATISNIRELTGKANQSDITGMMQNLNKSVNEMNILLSDINQGQGSMGKLMKDPLLYNNLNTTVQNANELMIDFKANPRRYVGFSIFGAKK
jgi:phospholipid/cholesterol/gamma-HCH transport system substrate-binding protein